MYNRKAMKREAKQLMRASVPHFMLVALVYFLLTSSLSTAVSWLTNGGTLGIGALSIFLTILVGLFSIVMGVGFSNYALRLARREETGMGSLFQAFSFAGRSIGMNLLVALFTFLWSLLGIVGFGIVIGVLAATVEAPAVLFTAVFILYLALFAMVIVISLRYAMAPFALVDDPDIGALEAVRRSVRMMRGYKGKLFVLELSFIGWELLAALIVMVVMAIGFGVSGAGWLVEAIMAAGDDTWEIYTLTESLMGQMAVWTLLAELVCLPLSLWLMVYEQTAAARFYNYVGGYDYHQYMNRRPADAQAPLTPPQQPPVEGNKAEQPGTPPTPDSFYSSILPPEEPEAPEPPEEEPEAPGEDEEI